MKKGDTTSGFKILDIVHLEELKAEGIWARHTSGAEVFHVINDDEENLFAFAFSTAVNNSTGVAHILEHSVLCGSEKYPLKDAFLVLAQGSMQTFLNAWTFPDKTVYPASSINEKDYFNLMAVYGDAVFHPLLSEWTFMQEGWRLNAARKGLEYTGVVYNEMKGAYSSMDRYAGHHSVEAVMPDTPYAFDSGGDPAEILNLSWDDLKAFHRERYAPANCRIFLAGNIPTEKQLAFIGDILAGLEPGSAAPAIPKVNRKNAPLTVRVPCPGREKPHALLSWLCADAADTVEITALSCLEEILLGHDGSPLTRALVESGLGEDLSPISGLDSELRESVFSMGLRSIIAEGEKTEDVCRRMEALILDELRRLVKEGISRNEIEAALLSREFSHREIKRSHGPFSLVWMRRAFRGWLYGTKPWESLLIVSNFLEVKRRVTERRDASSPGTGPMYNRYFESLIEKHLLNNPHRALVIVEAEEDFFSGKEKELEKNLQEKEKLLSDEEKKQLKKKNAELEKIQGAKDTQEALERIPHLGRGDIDSKIEHIPSEMTTLFNSDVPCMVHPIFTNGISYIDLAFPVDVLNPEDYQWLSMFNLAIDSVGLPGMDYGEVSSRLALVSGGLTTILKTGSVVPENGSGRMLGGDLLGRDWIIYRLKALDEKLIPSLDLTRRLITEADFSDLRRLKDLALEMKSFLDSSIAHGGSDYAQGRSEKTFSRSNAVAELWDGLDQIAFSHKLAAMDMGELGNRLTSIRDKLAGSGLLVNLTSSPESVKGALKAAETFRGFGCPKAANPECSKKESFLALLKNKKAEVYTSPSLQVGFAAMSLPSTGYASPEHMAEIVFSHELSTGALWESIRMMGGAYGAHAHPDSREGVFSFSTYRDPDPARSLELFPGILKKRGEAGIDEDSLEKTLIGVYAKATHPQTPVEKGFGEFTRQLCGINEEHRLYNRKKLPAVSAEDTNAVACRLAAAARNSPCFPVVIAGRKAAEKAAKKLNTEVVELPV